MNAPPRFTTASLQRAETLTDADQLTSPILPSFAYPVHDLWEPSLA